jgi:branched-chain amino acid transport system permease protein
VDILPQLIINGIITGSIYALASAGLALSYGLLRVINFAHGHLMMVGAYVFYLAKIELELNLAESIIFTTLGTSLVALLSFGIFVRPFTKYSSFLPLVSTLALGTVLESIIAMTFGVNVKSLDLSGSQSYEIGSIFITPTQIIIIASALILMSLMAIVIHRTSIGRMVRGVAEHSQAAESLGVDQGQIAMSGFVIGALMAAFAGVLIGYETNLQPTMGAVYTIKAFAVMVLGGLGNTWGALVGSFILGMLENISIGLDLGSWSLPAGYKDAFAYACILLVLLFRPQGLFGRPQRGV